MATAMHHDLVSPRIEERRRRGQLTDEQVDAFREFLDRVERDLLHHRIISQNAYTRWFRDGQATDAELAHFVRQFSVFSNQFLVAALLRVINAPTLRQARAAKEILMNELGVIYRRTDGPPAPVRTDVDEESKDQQGDPELVSTEGTVNGGLFRFRAAHFEWLLAVGEALDLGFDDLGKRRHGRSYTLHFCDELQRLYGSEDDRIAEGASFAVENWAAAGFWQELEDGLLHIKSTRLPGLKVAFFTWHNRVEAQHAGHTMEELEDVFFDPRFDEAKFFHGAYEVLDAIAMFWDGLEDGPNPRMSHPEITSMANDALALKRIDHVRMFVGNARQSAYFYRNAFGFDVVAYAGLETGVRHEACYVLRQGQITFVLASPLRGDHPEAHRLLRHGDGVQSIALEVDDVPAAFESAVARGASPATPPCTTEDALGSYDFAEIHAYGDTTHAFVNRSRYRGVFAPGFKPLEPDRYSPRTFRPVGLKAIDHIVANVEEGKMGDWVDYYSKIMGFSLLASFDDKDISTDYSALMSKVVTDGRGRIKFPINEPARSRRRSQIEEFLDYYGGPGVQHIAMATGDIIASVRAMAANDVSFLRVPPAYYELLPERVGTIREDLGELKELGILVDRDDEGYLLQIFTKPVADRPTLFFEIIQRRGAKSFGKGNFKALFEAIEREQMRRGTL